jgi:hypothetical protein
VSRARLRSSVALLALVACAYSASAARVDDAQARASNSSAVGDDGCGPSIPPFRINDLQGRRPRTVHIDGGDVDREVGLTRGGRSGDDACRECSPDLLTSREQDSCSRARRLNHDPSLGPSVLGERRRVFHQFELQNIDEETNRSVIVVNDESEEFQLRHLHVS